MQVRNATEADIPQMVAMGGRFYETTAYPGIAPYCTHSAEALAHVLLAHGVVLVADAGDKLVGVVGLLLAPFMFNAAYRTAHEVLWWVDADQRSTGAGVALMRAVEPACRERGATAIQMLHLENSPASAAAMYRRLGFALSESSYMKVL